MTATRRRESARPPDYQAGYDAGYYDGMSEGHELGLETGRFSEGTAFAEQVNVIVRHLAWLLDSRGDVAEIWALIHILFALTRHLITDPARASTPDRGR